MVHQGPFTRVWFTRVWLLVHQGLFTRVWFTRVCSPGSVHQGLVNQGLFTRVWLLVHQGLVPQGLAVGSPGSGSPGSKHRQRRIGVDVAGPNPRLVLLHLLPQRYLFLEDEGRYPFCTVQRRSENKQDSKAFHTSPPHLAVSGCCNPLPAPLCLCTCAAISSE